MFSQTHSASNESESNVDANSLLTELDKGLRSSKTGEQCEAIVRFPWLFERYPFPILINSACLKLAEVYRNGSNFLRVLILKVITESEKHLDKIVNIEEFVRRLFSVSFSNDPLARTITLRTLAQMARIVSTRKNIHHYIRNSLDSHDDIEVNAAIEASARFASKSDEFAANIYPKVVSMITGLTTPLDTKINLLSVLHHVHYSSDIADDVRQNCIQFLLTYPSKKFICNCLHTLTKIASTSLTHIADQIDLLLKYFTNDPRKCVKLSVLRDLKYLAATSPHLWQKHSTTTLVESILLYDPIASDGSNLILCQVLSVFAQLVNSPIYAGEPHFYSELCAKIIQFCLKVIHSEKQDIELISTCIRILTNLSLNLDSSYELNASISQETCCAIQSFLLRNVISEDHHNPNNAVVNKNATKIFKCILSLFSSKEFVSQSLLINQITETIRFVIINVDTKSIWFALSCDALCAIVSVVTDRNILFADDILSLIMASTKNESVCDNISKVYTMYFQACDTSAIDEQKSNSLITYLKGQSIWCCFKVVRQAMRYGHHLFASFLLQKLRDMEQIENIHFWIISLTRISSAESHLKEGSDLDKSLNTSISLYIEGLIDLKASISANNPLKFQCEYVKLRLKYLQTHHYFRQCCKLIRTSPPPAIAASTALSTRDDLLKYGNIVIAMRKSAKEFRLLAEAYSTLYQSSFNADDHTLAHLQLLQHSCTILAEAVENLFQSNRLNSFFLCKDTFRGDSNLAVSTSPLEHRDLIKMCNKIANIIHCDLNATSSESITGKQIMLLLKVSSELLKVALCFPRYFFQAIQNTCIKLAISPQPKSGDLLLIHNNTNFALRIEGVVVNSNNETLIRKVGKILISVTGILLRSSNHSANDQQLKNNDSNLSLQSVVVPFNDYFQAQFLLSLTTSGLYTINIETSIIDENEAQWKTGPNLSLSAKVVEDPSMACK